MVALTPECMGVLDSCLLGNSTEPVDFMIEIAFIKSDVERHKRVDLAMPGLVLLTPSLTHHFQHILLSTLSYK